jgi:lactoylglutathione lyase
VTDDRTERTRRLAEEFLARSAAGDPSLLDDLVAPDFVNHAAGPQGREGWRATFATLRHDLGDHTLEVHQVLVDGDHVAARVTLHGRHVASTMPLLAGVPVTGAVVSWEFVHVFRVSGDRVVEHWACRDDLGLLRQLGAWPPGAVAGPAAPVSPR